MVNRKIFGLIGRNIGHSFSGNFFNNKFAGEGIGAEYRLFDLQNISQIETVLKENPNLSGLNVTSPYKKEVIPFLDKLDASAQSVDAVNVIEFKDYGHKKVLVGHNTDFKGFRQTLGPLGISKEDRALILGSGGASRAVAFALQLEGIDFKIVSRMPSKGQISYEEASAVLPDIRLVINATPLGMGKDIDKVPPLDYSALSDRHICYDLIYNPPKTLFLKTAEEKGARIVNGLDMLVNQAVLSWEIWNSNKP